MIKITKTYTDYNGNSRTEDFLFHLTKAEVMELELSVTGGLTETINRMIAAQDYPELVKLFKKLIKLSYGEKSADGRRFEKNDTIFNNFASTEAYSMIFMELATDEKKAAEFINNVIPSDMVNNADTDKDDTSGFTVTSHDENE